MKFLLIPIIVLFSCSSTIIPPYIYAIDTYGNVEVDSIIKVVSGTSFRANLKGYPEIIGRDIRIYLYGVYSPSIRIMNKEVENLAIKARDFTARAFERAETIELRNMHRHLIFFILVAEVYVDGENLGKKLLRAKLAKQYYGGEKPRWE